MAYVIWVEFDVREADRQEFIDRVKENAALSVENEPGCQRFDVLEPDNVASPIALYEIYDSEAAFKLHLGSAHFRDFDAQSAPLVLKKIVRSFSVHQNAK